MKSIMVVHALCIILFMINIVSSQPIPKSYLYRSLHNLTREPEGQLLLKARLQALLNQIVKSQNSENIQLMKTKPNTKLITRDSWENSDDHYFQWAAKNRRPMELLAGRRRSIDKLETGPKSRIKTGIWRSGLVG